MSLCPSRTSPAIRPGARRPDALSIAQPQRVAGRGGRRDGQGL